MSSALTSRLRDRLALLLPLALAASCASTSQVILQQGTAGFRGACPIAVRPGTEQLVYAAGDELLAVDADYELLDYLLIEDGPSILDLAFRSDEELVVLHRSGISLYFAGKLIQACALHVPAGSLLAADDEAVWIARREDQGTTLLRLDEENHEFRPVAALADRVSALATAPGGCFLAIGDAVYRLVLREDRTGELLLILAAARADIESIAADPDQRLLFAATDCETLVYHEGKTRILEPLGGRLAYDDDTLYISSADEGKLLRITRVASRLAELESEDP